MPRKSIVAAQSICAAGGPRALQSADPHPCFAWTARALLATGVALTAWSADAAEMRNVTEVPAVLAAAGFAPAQLFARLPSALGLDAASSFSVGAAEDLPNKQGQTVRLNQLYQGVPVWGQQVVVQLTPQNEAVYIHGTAMYGIAGDAGSPSPTLSASDAMQRAKADATGQSETFAPLFYESEQNELVYYPQGETLRLAYRVSFYTELKGQSGDVVPTRPVYFIDAHTGETIYTYENLQSAALGTGPGGNQKTGQWTWGSSATFPKFEVVVNGGTCTLDSTNVFAQDWGHSSSQTGTAIPFAFGCYNNTYQAINGAYSPLNDAQSFGVALYNMYQSWYGIPPIMQKLWLRVHFGSAVDNAYWNGTAMLFGDGATTFYPLVGIDVMGHEVSHGFTEQHSNLVYSAQSGGMNEAYSDMAGEALESYYFTTIGQIFPRAMPDYQVGAELFKASGQALRYMCNPPLDGGSIGHISGYVNGIDVHLSSGVYNKAFCVLAATSGWGPRKAFDVFLLANKNYWGPNETFRTGADAVLQATAVYGYSAADVKAAFDQVGIGPLPSQTGNNNFANAVTILSGRTSVVGTNVGATKETGEPNLTFNNGGKSVWYNCKAQASGSATVNTNGSSFDTILGIFTGNAVNALTPIAENDDGGTSVQSLVTFAATAGTTYRIMVDGYNGASGDVVVGLSNLACAGVQAPNDLIVDFGGAGLYQLLDNATFQKINNTSPVLVDTADMDGNGQDEVVAAFSGSGIYVRYNNSTWVSLHPSTPTHLASGDFDNSGKDDVVADFGASGLWVRYNDATWTKIHNSTTQGLAVGNVDGVAGDDLVVDFGSAGLWVRYNNATWAQINAANVEGIAVGDLDGNGKDDVIADFGAGGLWVRYNNATWTKINNGNVESLATGDLDGSGQDDVIADFGASGLWVRYNNVGFTQINTGNVQDLASGDLDSSGMDEVIADFGAGGLWVRYNNATWTKLNPTNPEGLAIGNVN